MCTAAVIFLNVPTVGRIKVYIISYHIKKEMENCTDGQIKPSVSTRGGLNRAPFLEHGS